MSAAVGDYLIQMRHEMNYNLDNLLQDENWVRQTTPFLRKFVSVLRESQYLRPGELERHSGGTESFMRPLGRRSAARTSRMLGVSGFQ